MIFLEYVGLRASLSAINIENQRFSGLTPINLFTLVFLE